MQQSEISTEETTELVLFRPPLTSAVLIFSFLFHSSAEIPHLFRRMFPNSVIAQNFNCADTKVKYLSTFGLGEYFSQQLIDKVKNESFVLLFDESLNKKMQKKQMDVHLRFWNGDSIATMCYTSIFMSHAKATDLVQHLENVLAKVSHNGLIQLSMDGPHVNWKAFELLQSNLESEHGNKMLNVGSCGLTVFLPHQQANLTTFF